MGSNVQVVWEKFCRYFDVEPRYLPMEQGRYVITPEQVLENVDENTIGVVAILGTTFTGELEPIGEICAALDKLAAGGGLDVPVHVDAASGGFVVPFLHPDLEWDFRLPRVVSINVSGHKYGLTYPGIGFVVWRSKEHLPEDLVFRVNYLGGDMPTFTLNFSRPGNQVVGQYYNFLRLGRAGYTRVMECLTQTARWLGDELRAREHFEVITDGSAIPVIASGWQAIRLHRVRRLARPARLRLAGACVHDAGERDQRRRAAHRGAGGVLGRHGQSASRRRHHGVGPPRRAEAPRLLRRAAAVRPLVRAERELVLENSTKVRAQLHVRPLDRCAGRAQSRSCALDDDVWPVPQHVRADADDPPAQRFEFGLSVDVARPYRGVRPMLSAVILDANQPVVPPHVDAALEGAESIEHFDLRTPRPQSRRGKNQPRPCFLR